MAACYKEPSQAVSIHFAPQTSTSSSVSHGVQGQSPCRSARCPRTILFLWCRRRRHHKNANEVVVGALLLDKLFIQLLKERIEHILRNALADGVISYSNGTCEIGACVIGQQRTVSLVSNIDLAGSID